MPTSLRNINEGPDYMPADIAESMSRLLVGQPGAIESIVPYVDMYHADLSPEGRPVGVFLLLGPTGTGKTRTVEALAEALHGSPKRMVKIDCGEFQMEHEVARLIGAPPGYLGHRETQPLITQKRLAASTSEASKLSIVLFDEIEKAAASLSQLLLGVLDKATLHLGDNTVVNFENTLVFMTSNLGAREMTRRMRPDFGFETAAGAQSGGEVSCKLERIGMSALRKRFSPEFVNRIDAVVTYSPLERGSLEAILAQQLDEFRDLVDRRMGDAAFTFELSEESIDRLIEEGTVAECGAREIKRVVHRRVVQPLAALVARGQIEPEAHVEIVLDGEESALTLLPRAGRGKGGGPRLAKSEPRYRLSA